MDFLNIHMGTLLIVLVLGHILTAVLIVSYTVRNSKSKSANVFLMSKLLQTAAWVMLGLRGIFPGIILAAVGNTVLFTGAALELIALMMLNNGFTGATRRNYIGLMAACIVVFNAATALGSTENIRITFASAITAVLMAFPVYKLFEDKTASVLQRVIAVFYAVTMLLLLFRAYSALFTDRDMNLMSTNIFNTWMFLLLYLVMLAGSTGFILLDKEKQDRELLRAATFDELPNIYNRRTFLLRSKEVLSLFARRREQVSYRLIDIDNFKKINDVYGHYAGDAVLQSFAAAMRNQLRAYDLFGRFAASKGDGVACRSSSD